MQETVKKWLEEGIVDVFLGYKSFDGHMLPHCFVKEKIEEVDQLRPGPVRYSLEKIAVHMVALDGQIKIGMLARDCNQRAVNALIIWNQFKPENIKTMDVNCCPSNLRKHADCSYLDAELSGDYKKQVGIDNNLPLNTVEDFEDSERLYRWMYEFQKCIKCYGCRNICPVCFCSDCSLENEDLVGSGRLPPEAPIFHLVRAVHMAGRCIDCGLCEDACPVDIPLRMLYRKVNTLCTELFDYQAGVSDGPSPFNMIGDQAGLRPKPLVEG